MTSINSHKHIHTETEIKGIIKDRKRKGVGRKCFLGAKRILKISSLDELVADRKPGWLPMEGGGFLWRKAVDATWEMDSIVMQMKAPTFKHLLYK